MRFLRFKPENGKTFDVKLNKDKQRYTIENILTTKSYIFEDIDYTFEIVDDEDELNDVDLQVYFNGDKMESIMTDHIIKTSPLYKGGTTFGGRIGFIQISICITDCQGNDAWLYTEYLSIMIKSTDFHRSIDAMLNYIYENQADILFDNAIQISGGENYKESYEDFWSQIMLFEEIVSVYENLYGYFKANCRAKLTGVEIVDRTDKLQNVDARTIHFIMQHPEYLKKNFAGIEIRNHKYLPSKTMMIQKRITHDIYENQVVLSFLKKMYMEIEKLRLKIYSYKESLNMQREYSDGYIMSSYIIYQNAYEILREFGEKVITIENRIGYLYMWYKKILDVREMELLDFPTPTAVFMSIPQYNRIYTCIHNWYGKTGYDFQKEKVMLGFFDGPSIYESYVLIKMINLIKAIGYQLVEARHVRYELSPGSRYVPKEYNNTFVFKCEGQKITIFYEPIIYDEDRREINEIGLYRNNTNSLTGNAEKERNGHCYYVPDFVIKAEYDNKERYIICDAKYTKNWKVKEKFIPELSYKYLLSISTVEDYMDIVGLCIIYGITENEQRIKSFFDREIEGTRKKEPFIDYMPLTEEISYTEQVNNLQVLFQKLFSS